MLVCRSPDEAQLSPTELIQALYPSGVDGAMEAGCITWTTDDMLVCFLHTLYLKWLSLSTSFRGSSYS